MPGAAGCAQAGSARFGVLNVVHRGKRQRSTGSDRAPRGAHRRARGQDRELPQVHSRRAGHHMGWRRCPCRHASRRNPARPGHDGGREPWRPMPPRRPGGSTRRRTSCTSIPVTTTAKHRRPRRRRPAAGAGVGRVGGGAWTGGSMSVGIPPDIEIANAATLRPITRGGRGDARDRRASTWCPTATTRPRSTSATSPRSRTGRSAGWS